MKKRNYFLNFICNFINYLIVVCVVRFNVCVKYLMWGENFDEMLFIFEIMLLVLFVVMVIG